jgi:hypothetical protein
VTRNKDKQRATWRRYHAKHRARVKAIRLATKARLKAEVDSLKGRPCADCGRRFPPCAMDFDHVRGAKVNSIAQLVNSYQPRATRVEIVKCELVCACCHRIRTHKRRHPTEDSGGHGVVEALEAVNL